ncbi:uncharacterized protein [Anabrus simplex]|uniref:uncharacterized protein n=1 Tax=Anabrus simplex TaxID=316456 RepID=UPI0034DD9049
MKDECLHDSLAHFTTVFQVLSLLNTARRDQGGDDTSTDLESALRKLSEVLVCLRTVLSRTGLVSEADSSTAIDETQDHTEQRDITLPVIPLVDIKKALLEYQRTSDDLLIEVFLYSRLLKIMQAMKKANESKQSRRKTVRFTSPRMRNILPQGSPSPQIRKNDTRQTSSSSKRRSIAPGLAEAREKKRGRIRMPASPLRTSMVTRRRASCYVPLTIEEEV